MLSAVIAVAGTLLGAVVAGLIQHRTTRAAQDETRRTAIVNAVSSLTAALADHRRAMWVREDLRLTGGSSEAYRAARAASHATRSAVTAPHTALAVLAPQLAPLADAAARATYALRGAETAGTLARLRDDALAATDRLVTATAEALA
ncbi:protein kilB [Streptomyces sp. S1]|uniref:protein kilB n=1 Tax=Streptomyces sp. S1 TaxID=718288 RepID=UPI000EF7CA39|nr:protein kilB [Streptomyces sp. S1]